MRRVKWMFALTVLFPLCSFPLSAQESDNPALRIDVEATMSILLGDVNSDGQVDAADYDLLAGALAASPGGAISRAAADLNADGRIDSQDLVLLSELTRSVPRIVSFTAAPSEVDPGGAAALSWHVSGALEMTITPEIGAVAPGTGTADVHPSATTDYTLLATNAAGTATASARVTVNSPCVPPSIEAHPANQTIDEGATATLTVTATGTGIVYQWYRGSSGETTMPVGTNSSTYTTPVLDATAPYWCRVVGTCGSANSQTATVTVIPLEIRFTTEGATFSPVIVVSGTPEILWTFADGSTSSAVDPVKDYGAAGRRLNTLRVTPWSALQRINIGYDGGDGGSSAIEAVPDQHVSAVQGLERVAPYLGQWCSSYNDIPSLDFSNFVNLDTIECFLSSTLAQVKLANTPKLKRACFEDCNLASLDLSQSPSLEDLRGAQNAYPTIDFGAIGAHVWHICIRDNPQLTDQTLFADLTQFPNISELFIWNDNQSGMLRVPASNPSRGVYLLADGNHYTSLNLAGALRNPHAQAIVSLRNNQLESVNIAGCVQIMEIYLENNQLNAAQLDALLAVLDALGRSKLPTDLYTLLQVDIHGNEAPSAAGYASAVNLAAKGWRIVAEGWTLEPPPPPDTGEKRVDFTTTGDHTVMQVDFWGSTTTAVWHWSDGTTTPAVSGASATKAGLGPGEHAHYLVVSNGAALTRFGAASGGGQGHLASIAGLNDCPYLDVLYAYNEASLTALSRTNLTRVREFHLWGTGLTLEAMDQIFADAVLTGVANGIIWCSNGGTAASASDRATLVERGWALYY